MVEDQTLIVETVGILEDNKKMEPAQGSTLQQKILQAHLPKDVEEKLAKEKSTTYTDFVLSLPFNKISQDILDIQRAKQILDKNHYGLEQVKARILEYLSVLILHRRQESQTPFHAPVLLLVGLVGTGKTSLASSIAEALGRPMERIPFGGLGDPSQLRGTSRVQPDAEPGLTIKAISASRCKNPVILLDEIDRIAESKITDVMGVLVELLDPAQNHAFTDHYLDFPFDLSQVLFIATANNTSNIATAVMDRLEPIQMPSYSDEEKLIIAKNYLLPKAVKEAGLDNIQVIIDETMWPQIIRPLGYDGGIRSLNRTLEEMIRKIARKVVEGNLGPFKITNENIEEYIPS